MKLSKDDIFSPFTITMPLCSQVEPAVVQPLTGNFILMGKIRSAPSMNIDGIAQAIAHHRHYTQYANPDALHPNVTYVGSPV